MVRTRVLREPSAEGALVSNLCLQLASGLRRFEDTRILGGGDTIRYDREIIESIAMNSANVNVSNPSLFLIKTEVEFLESETTLST